MNYNFSNGRQLSAICSCPFTSWANVRTTYLVKALLLTLFQLIMWSARSQNSYTGFTYQSGKNQQVLPVQILYPVDFQANKKYPLLLFLHGAGERGNDNQKQLAHFHELLKDVVNSGQFPAIVVFPHCPVEDYWANAKIDRYPNRLDIEYLVGGEPTKAMQNVISLMDSLSKLKFVDQSRIYAGGLSMGGMGTFEILYRRPDMFAAAFPICGGAHPETAKTYADKVKLWVFHGDQDPIVLPKFSIQMVEALREAGADPTFTLYKGVKHDSWKNAREEAKLLPWLFGQRKKTPLRLHSYISSNVVFQRDQPISIEGTGYPGERININWRGNIYEMKIDDRGKLSYRLPSEKAGGPYEMTIKGADTIISISNILIGDVWFASGQSNMEWTLEKSEGGSSEIAGVNFDQIRFFKAPREMEFRPKNDVHGSADWVSATSEHIGKYSGVAYFYAKKIHQETGIPIGIIDASWGGTMIETWMSDEALRPFEIHNVDLDVLKNRTLSLKETEKKAKTIFEQWKENSYKKGIGLDEKWYERQTDLSDWQPLQVPGYWEDQLPEYADFDGAMWYRRSFDVPKSFLPHDIRVWLSQIDDHNMCWINGQYIGETYFSSTWTNYLIPAGLLKEKENEIVLRVFDVEGKGGLTGLDTYFDFYPEGDRSVRARLNGTWLIKAGSPFTGNQSIHLANIGHSPNHYPTLLYNGMVSPYRHFPLKGVIWYQGESNKLNAYFYRELFQAMIVDWRNTWVQTELPFYYVQIAAYNESASDAKHSASAELRESQAWVQTMPYTRMVTALDLGDPDDIHPLKKREVGERLALHALKNDYNRPELSADSPTYLSHVQKGNKLIVRFTHAEGLITKDGLAPKSFTIANENGDFLVAKAALKKNEIMVWHPAIKQPAHVRYAWADYPEVNVINAAGLPLLPFRTDHRPVLTQQNKRPFK